MDAYIASRDSLSWDVGDVLRQIGLRSKNIGIFGWVGKEVDKTYVAITTPGSNKNVHLILRSSTDVLEFKWRSFKYTNNQPGPVTAYQTLGDFNANSAIEILLDQTFSGIYSVQVHCKSPGSPAPLIAEYKIVVP
jgi:hypothetical protein